MKINKNNFLEAKNLVLSWLVNAVSVLLNERKINTCLKWNNHFTQHPLKYALCISAAKSFYTSLHFLKKFNPLPHMSILGSSSSAATKGIMSKIWTNGDTIIWLSRKHYGKRRNCSLWAISPFPTVFSKAVCCWCIKMSIYGLKGKTQRYWN